MLAERFEYGVLFVLRWIGNVSVSSVSNQSIAAGPGGATTTTPTRLIDLDKHDSCDNDKNQRRKPNGKITDDYGPGDTLIFEVRVRKPLRKLNCSSTSHGAFTVLTLKYTIRSDKFLEVT